MILPSFEEVWQAGKTGRGFCCDVIEVADECWLRTPVCPGGAFVSEDGGRRGHFADDARPHNTKLEEKSVAVETDRSCYVFWDPPERAGRKQNKEMAATGVLVSS